MAAFFPRLSPRTSLRPTQLRTQFWNIGIFWHQIQLSPSISGIHLCLSIKQGTKLKDKLVRANILPSPKQTLLAQLEPGNYPCGNCAQCHNISKTIVFRHPRTGKTFPQWEVLTFNAKKSANIGKTTRPLQQRISEHKSSINRKDKKVPCSLSLQ